MGRSAKRTERDAPRIGRSTIWVCSTLMLAVSLIGAVTASSVKAAGKQQLKFGTIAPKGSLYHRTLEEVGQRWKKEAGRQARFTVYPGGTQGGELAMVRRMRIGQLDGAMLSTVGLDAIDARASALQFLPLAFRDWAEFDYVASRIRPAIEQAMEEKGFVVLMWGEAGWVQWYAKTPIKQPEDFRNLKLFGWGLDSKSSIFFRDLGFQIVSIETNAILPALQTGMLDAIPMPAFYALASQVDRAAPHMLDIRWAPIVGAALITRRAWKRLTEAERNALRAGAANATRRLRANRDRIERESVAAMKARGLSVQAPDAETLSKWYALLDGAYPKLRGSLVPAEMFDRVFSLLAEFRSGKGR